MTLLLYCYYTRGGDKEKESPYGDPFSLPVISHTLQDVAR